MQSSSLPAPSPEDIGALLAKDGVAGGGRALAILATVPGIESNAAAQSSLADVVGVLLDARERGDFDAVIRALTQCPPELAALAKTLLASAFFPDGKIEPAHFDDSALLCFALFAAAEGKPGEASDLIESALQQRGGDSFARDAERLRAHIGDDAGGSLPLSVIVPSYKGDDWILDGLDSLAAQSLPWRKFEVILVINGPRTRTPELVQAWLAGHPGFPLVVIATETAGASHARNLGLDNARGEYIVFMDDDDRAGRTMLEALLRHAKPDVVPMVPAGLVHDGAWDTPDHDNWINRNVLPRLGRVSEWPQLGGAVALTWGKAWHRERALRVRFDEVFMNIGEDRLFSLGYVAQGPCALHPVILDNDSAYLWAIRDGSLSIRAIHMNEWDRHVEPWLDVAGALANVPVATPQATVVRNCMVGDVVHTFIGSDLRRHPADEQRVVDGLVARGIEVQ